MQTQHKKVGDLNGMWAFLFRVFLVLFPLMVAWSIWVTSSMYELKGFAQMGERMTQKDGLKMKLELLELIDKQVDRLDDKLNNLPPVDFVKRVDGLEDRLNLLHEVMIEIRLNMAKDKHPK